MSVAISKTSEWRPNPHASRFNEADRRRLMVLALAAELGPELAILAPDVAEAFPDSESVNAALRAVLDAAKTVKKLHGKRRSKNAARITEHRTTREDI